MERTVFVGMSGGVDSSVAAYLLKEQGYRVVGVFLRCYNLDGCAEQDAEDARRVAEHIGIPFYVWNFEEAYKTRVVQYMIEGYRAGITPNPDVMCNREIKFGLFLEKAFESGANFVATGHYVKLITEPRDDGGKIFSLRSANDANKDQSYFLWTLTQRQLPRCLFPIGEYEKPAVREIARQAGLPTAEKKDSQGICFLGKFSLEDFLKDHIPSRPGKLVTTHGESIGEHSGAEFYTIGQRHLDADFAFKKTGRPAPRKPLYVAAKDTTTNTVVMAEGADDPALFKECVTLAQVNVISGHTSMPGSGMPVYARVRYRQPLAPAELTVSLDGTYSISFKEPQRFVAEGQSAVWYDAVGIMRGGGIII